MNDAEKLKQLENEVNKLSDKFSNLIDDFDKHLSLEAFSSPEGQALLWEYFRTVDFFRSALGRMLRIELDRITTPREEDA